MIKDKHIKILPPRATEPSHCLENLDGAQFLSRPPSKKKAIQAAETLLNIFRTRTHGFIQWIRATDQFLYRLALETTQLHTECRKGRAGWSLINNRISHIKNSDLLIASTIRAYFIDLSFIKKKLNKLSPPYPMIR